MHDIENNQKIYAPPTASHALVSPKKMHNIENNLKIYASYNISASKHRGILPVIHTSTCLYIYVQQYKNLRILLYFSNM